MITKAANAGAFLINATISQQRPGFISDTRSRLLAFTRLVTADDVEQWVATGVMTTATAAALESGVLEYVTGPAADRMVAAMRAGVGAMSSPTVLFSSLPQGAVDAALNARVAELAQSMNGAMSNAVAELTAQGIRNRAGSRTLTAMLQNAVALTRGQVRSLAILQASLEEREVTDAQQARAIDSRAAGLRAQRAATIARTEIATAYNRGTQLAVESVVGSDTAGVTKTWRTQADEVVCPICGPLDTVTVGLLETFPGVGALPPAHVNCRCVVTYEVPL